MKKFGFVFLYFISIGHLHAQMRTSGDNPRPIYQKFPFEYQYTNIVDLVHCDMGWFDDYLNSFMIDHTGRMWIAGDHGLSYSDDKGLNWHSSLTRYATFSIFETRKHALLTSSNNEFLLRSENRGQTWKHQKVSGMHTGRSSHGERYDAIFYTQVDDDRIIRTTQYQEAILISDNDGKSWRKQNIHGHPESIYNIHDSLLVMFTYDEMFISRDRGETWKEEDKGLPLCQNYLERSASGQYTGVITTGVVTEDGTIMALVESQEEDSYEHRAYFFDLEQGKWIKDASEKIYDWREDYLMAAGKNRILLYDGNTRTYSVSFDKGKTWGNMTGNYDAYSFPHDLWVDGDNVYFCSSATLSVIHFPLTCGENNPELPVVKNQLVTLDDSISKVVIFPINAVVENTDDFSIFQICAARDSGVSRFIMHIPNDTILNAIYIVDQVGGLRYLEHAITLNAALKQGDYELWLYTSEWKGAYFLQCHFSGAVSDENTGTVCYFY